MTPVFTLITVICAIMAVGFFQAAKSAIHEILAAIMFLSAIISASAAAICSRLDRLLNVAQREGDNNWNVGVAIWRQLREPGKHTEPEPLPEDRIASEAPLPMPVIEPAPMTQPANSGAPRASRWLLILPLVVLAILVIGAIIRANGIRFWFEL